MNIEDKPAAGVTTPIRRRRRLWLWFAAGFLLVFAGMLVLVHVTAMQPSGQFVVQYRLWEYYTDGLPRLFRPAVVGPASGGESALLTIGLLHVLFSAVGGAAGVAVGYSVSGFRSRKTAEPVAHIDSDGPT